MFCSLHITQCVQLLTLKYLSARLEYLALLIHTQGNPGFLLFSMSWILEWQCPYNQTLHIRLQILSHRHVHTIHTSPNISQLMLSILKTVCCISKMLCLILSEMITLCLNRTSVHASYNHTHTMVLNTS
jgi:hypothetical protein